MDNDYDYRQENDDDIDATSLLRNLHNDRSDDMSSAERDENVFLLSSDADDADETPSEDNCDHHLFDQDKVDPDSWRDEDDVEFQSAGEASSVSSEDPSCDQDVIWSDDEVPIPNLYEDSEVDKSVLNDPIEEFLDDRSGEEADNSSEQPRRKFNLWKTFGSGVADKKSSREVIKFFIFFIILFTIPITVEHVALDQKRSLSAKERQLDKCRKKALLIRAEVTNAEQNKYLVESVNADGKLLQIPEEPPIVLYKNENTKR